MTRTLLATLAIVLAALLAAPVALAQGPPPGYTDPVAYAQDYADDQAAQAQADPVGYAGSKDAVAEAEHALWLACWTAYETAGHVADPACAAFFTAPVQVDPAAEGAIAEITEVLNETGASALANELLDAVNDTVADPASAVDQVLRVVRAVLHFVRDLVDTVLDALGLGALGIAAGLLGAAQGLLDLVLLPVHGLQLAVDGLGLLGAGTASAAGGAATALLDSALLTLGAVLDGIQATGDATLDGLAAVGSAVAAAGRAAGDAAQAVASGVADAAQAATDAVQAGVHGLASEVSSWFGGGKAAPQEAGDLLDEAPETGTEADGLIERLLGHL